MSRLLLALLLTLCLASPSWAAIAYVSSVTAGAPAGAGTFTTGTFNSTGANLIVCGVSGAAATFPTFSDNMSNTYVTTLTKQLSGAANVVATQLIYVKNPTVGAGHTVTVTGAANTSAIGCLAFSGADTATAIDTETGATSANTSVTTLSTGSIGPQAGSVVVTALHTDSTGTAWTIDNTFIDQTGTAYQTSNHYGVRVAYKLDPGTVNPAWSWTTGMKTGAPIAAFLVSGTPPPVPQSSQGFLGAIIK